MRKSGGITKVDTVVVGSGISGATAAYYLHSKGINVLLTEAKDEVGGNLISKKGNNASYMRILTITKPAPALNYLQPKGNIAIIMINCHSKRFNSYSRNLLKLFGQL